MHGSRSVVSRSKELFAHRVKSRLLVIVEASVKIRKCRLDCRLQPIADFRAL
jgi:hypothetical protein